MLSLIRNGFHAILLRIEGEDILRGLEDVFTVSSSTWERIHAETGENETALIVSPKGATRKGIRLFRIRSLPCDILAFILNSPLRDQVRGIRILPRVILFRVTGDHRSTIEEIRRDFHAQIGQRTRRFWWSRKNHVTIAFTRKNLNHPLSSEDLLSEILYVDMPYEKLLIQLSNRSLEYFNNAMGNADWNSFEIRIFDAYERYTLHAERLRSVLDDLELGLVLGEGWGKDFARILMPVRVYRFRLFSFLSPEEVKETLMGLEFDGQGKRLVDMDLYREKEKVSWQYLGRKWNLTHAETGRKCRTKLLGILSDETIQRLEELEKGLSEN